MSKRLIVYPYKVGSGSASRLCEAIRALGHRALKVYPDRRYKPKRNDVILNWGCSTLPTWGEPDINHPDEVRHASNKLTALQAFTEFNVPTLVYTTSATEATTWLDFTGGIVVARHKLTGHSGEGIEIVTDESDDMPVSPLYTKYFKRRAEYRVHVWKDEVIDWQQKLRRRNFDGEVCTKVRSHSNGWIYARESGTEPDALVLDAAIRAVQALGLTFGAVDVAWNEHYKQPAVFEVNTAPGLEGTTLQVYVNAILEDLEEVV